MTNTYTLNLEINNGVIEYVINDKNGWVMFRTTDILKADDTLKALQWVAAA